MVRKLIPLYIADNFDALEALVQKDNPVRLLKTHRISNLAKKLKTELLLCQDDQEKCYILGKRYITLMDQFFKISDDQNHSRSLFIHDYGMVKDMVADLEEQLKDRYLAGLALKPLEIMKIVSPTGFKPSSDKFSSDNPIHKGLFIQPSDLIKFMDDQLNILILDIRPKDHFEVCKIIPPVGASINIAGNTICKGMSAQSLLRVLPTEYHGIWEKREKFDIIVIMDNNTSDYYYYGSNLEIVRNFIVEWDFNRKYLQAPVVLEGGLKAVIDCYPTKVSNPNMFIVESDANNEIDELLDLDSVTYPEPGATVRAEPPQIPPGEPINEADVEMPDIPADRITKMTKKQIQQAFDDLTLDTGKTKGAIGDGRMITDIAKLRSLVAEDREKLLNKARAAKSIVVSQVNDDQNLLVFYEAAKNLQKGKREDKRKALLKSARALKPNRGIPGRPATRRTPGQARVEPWDGSGFVGINNERNCCYMNCILQCLKVLPVIKWTYVTTNNYLRLTTKTPPRLNYHFALVMRDIWDGTEKEPYVVNHKYFRDQIGLLSPIYSKGHHEDTFEFFMFLFNTLHEDCQHAIERPKVMSESQKSWHQHLQGTSSFLIDAFYFQLRNTQICVNCKQPNYIFEVDSTLMLSVPDKPAHLSDLINDYMKQSIMTDYSCKDCKSLASIANIKDIIIAPEVLVVILKRGVSTKEGIRKSETEIDFALKDVKFGNCLYDLYSIAHHNGSLSHGHYYASVLVNKPNDIWLSCNDDKVSRFDYEVKELPRIFKSCTGFFYVKQNVNYA